MSTGGRGSAGTARMEILQRIAKATNGVRDASLASAHEAIPRTYRTAGDAPDARREAGLEARLERFEERLVDYDVDVVRCDHASLAATLRDVLDRLGARRIVVPADLSLPDASAWAGRTVLRDDAEAFELDEADATVSGCAVAVAETGSIVLDGGSGQGRRAATLIPDVHVCIVAASKVVALVPDAVADLSEAAREGAAFTWISGPSATSDIELVRVAGVHGPRTMIVLLVGDA